MTALDEAVKRVEDCIANADAHGFSVATAFASDLRMLIEVVRAEGFVLVPREPTQAIIDRMTASISLDGLPSPEAEPDPDYDDDMRRAYRAMIAAAPSPTNGGKDG